MADLSVHIKSAAWTEAEAVAVVAGGIVATKFLNDERIFAKHFKDNPLWFDGKRMGAPFFIRHSGAIKAAGACLAATYTANPWIKLALIGVAVQGTLQEVRMLTYDDKEGKHRFSKIGDAQTDLDNKLKELANQQRQMLNGPEYVNGIMQNNYESSVAGMNGPEYVQAQQDAATRYDSSVAGPIYDEDSHTGWSYASPDPSGAI